MLWKAQLSSGEIAANMALLVLVSSRLIPAMNRITGDLTGLWSTFPYIERLSALKNTLQDLIKNTKSIHSNEIILPMKWDKVKLENVCFKYDNTNKNAIDEVSLEIELGKSYGIAGPSGSGKSTLVNIILGLLAAKKGNVFLDDQILGNSNIYSWQKNIGYVPQDPFIMDDTLRANVAFGIPREDIDEQRVWQCLEMANMKDFCKDLEDKLDTYIGDEGARLSGGQRQRLAIARSLYDQPNLLVLDEATSSLDSISQQAIQKTINELHGKVTVIIIAHRLSTIKECDLIHVFDEGILIDSNTYDILKETCMLFKKLISSTSIINNEDDNPQNHISN
jgi:ABC-type multidrug transport system fused ATPase/permease subunit